MWNGPFWGALHRRNKTPSHRMMWKCQCILSLRSIIQEIRFGKYIRSSILPRCGCNIIKGFLCSVRAGIMEIEMQDFLQWSQDTSREDYTSARRAHQLCIHNLFTVQVNLISTFSIQSASDIHRGNADDILGGESLHFTREHAGCCDQCAPSKQLLALEPWCRKAQELFLAVCCHSASCAHSIWDPNNSSCISCSLVDKSVKSGQQFWAATSFDSCLALWGQYASQKDTLLVGFVSTFPE